MRKLSMRKGKLFGEGFDKDHKAIRLWMQTQIQACLL